MDKLIPFAINDITLPSHHLSTNNRKHIVYLTYKMMLVNCMSPLLKEANTHGIVLYLVEEDEILMSPLNQAFGRFQINSEAANLQISKIELRGRLQKLGNIEQASVGHPALQTSSPVSNHLVSRDEPRAVLSLNGIYEY